MNILRDLNLADFGLLPQDWQVFDASTLIVTKRDWPYLLATAFQEEMVERVALYKHERVLIFCSHPHCLTLGKGLQRRTREEHALMDFDENLIPCLPVPLHRVHRGGGVTFHYPGQLVFYPILSIEHERLGIVDLMNEVLRIVRQSLESLYGLNNLDHRHALLGLWLGQKKLASIGVSTRRFVSFHGLALNLASDEKISSVLGQIYPCGISGSLYTCLDTVVDSRDLFATVLTEVRHRFLDRFPAKERASEPMSKAEPSRL